MKRIARSISAARAARNAGPHGSSPTNSMVPLVHAREVGEAALRERAQRGSAWTPTGGTRCTSRCGSGRRAAASNAKSFTMSPRNDGSSRPSRRLGRRGAGLRELPGDAPDLRGRHAGAVREHDRHLQDDLELVADVVGREVGERLRAVAGVQEEPVARRDRARATRAGCAPRPRTRAAAGAAARRAPRRARRGSGQSGCCARRASRQLVGSTRRRVPKAAAIRHAGAQR